MNCTFNISYYFIRKYFYTSIYYLYDDNIIFIQSDNQYKNISSNMISCKNKLAYIRFMYIIFDVKLLKE